MDLYQVLVNVERHCAEARKFYKALNHEAAKDELADASGLIIREITIKDAVDAETEAKEEKPQTPGHCQPDQADKESS
jgi:hypothetical protein